MKRNIRKFIFAATYCSLLGWMSSCASTDEQQGDLLEENSGEGENGESTNNESSNEFSNPQGQGNQAFEISQGEEVNNESGNEFENQQLNLAQQGEAQLSNEAIAEQTAEIGNQVNANLGANSAATNGLSQDAAAANVAASNLLGSNAAMANPAAGSSTVPMTGLMVKYVKGQIQATDQPGSGNVVKTLEKGDHPLVMDEGEYAKMQNGTYVPLQSLSSEGVGRDRTGGQWNAR